jgi:hypothetical protein
VSIAPVIFHGKNPRDVSGKAGKAAGKMKLKEKKEIL